MMFSVLILTIVLASILGTMMAFGKSSVSVGEYIDMSHESRITLEVFSRDVRAASGISVVDPLSSGGVVYTESGMDLTFPDYFGDREVRYRYVSSSGTLSRAEIYNGQLVEKVLLSGMTQFKMQFFQAPGADFESISGPLASVNLWAKSIQLEAELLRSVMSLNNTDYIISTRFMMRNIN
jgi:hypothetical protein